jgi:hypothetical protein
MTKIRNQNYMEDIMKKILIILAILILFPLISYAAGSSITLTSDVTHGKFRTITVTAVADDTDGSIPSLTINGGTTGIKSVLTNGWALNRIFVDGDHAVTHDGSANASVLNDTDAGFDVNQWVDYTITNSTDSSSGTVTANTSSTVTATLSGGTDNDWDVSDAGVLGTEPQENSEIYVYQNGIDLLGGGGVDQVDNTSERYVPAKADGTNIKSAPIIGDVVVTITQQAAAVNSAIVFVKLIFERE